MATLGVKRLNPYLNARPCPDANWEVPLEVLSNQDPR